MVVAMTPHPRYQYKPEDLFLTVFVYVDDWLKPYQKGITYLGAYIVFYPKGRKERRIGKERETKSATQALC